ncbi:hypothetical protein O2W14_07045 [Modestobacter sp. VKM Ac-2986]|uniref:hypothetical protein n=1 Tax=Modestobacter sp. VKM Ac-2986 TaxID=3004140 RepID=UPI0022AAF414|nr:hypothetical protein [Modestobacter sp. VKM Ac-2986]MCZ2828584.1 hypothetical protein [Modestobacter sp. VKM Ac-2986]
MRSTTTAVLPAALALVVLAGCTSGDDPADDAAGGSGSAAQPAAVVTAAPDADRTLVPDAEPAAAAVSASRAVFASSPVAVVAAPDDASGQLLGAAAAVGLGVPLLLGDPDVVGPELDRLGVQSVLAVGADAAGLLPPGEDAAVVAVPAEAAAVAQATGLQFGPEQTLAPADRAAAVAGLAADSLPALSAEAEPASPSSASPSSSPSAAAEPGTLPAVTRGEALTDVVVLASGAPDSLAGIATARAAGAEVLLTGEPDPRASAEVVDRLATDPSVVVLGADLAAAPGIDWKLDTAATGPQLPGGGQLLFPEHMMVALYGIPGSGALGLLGEQDLPASIQRAQQLADEYRPLVDTTVVPTFEIIATVASSSAGADGDYSAEQDVETLRPWVEGAGAAGMYVVLDLQPGRSDFLSQAKMYQPLLELPHVGLALDPEWRLEPNGLPLQKIGQVGIDEVNSVVTWLADLTREKALPQKLLVLHQFQVRMVVDRERLDVSRDELAYMVHVDGQGGQSAKQDTWRVLHDGAQEELTWGWKNFIDEDLPMLTPEQTIEQVLPTPELVTYQ